MTEWKMKRRNTIIHLRREDTYLGTTIIKKTMSETPKNYHGSLYERTRRQNVVHSEAIVFFFKFLRIKIIILQL